MTSAAGVHILAQTSGWPGEAEIRTEVQPMRVVIENRGNKALLVTYENFSLLGPLGRSFAALPPYSIRGTADKPALGEDYAPLQEPGFTYHRFELSPVYGAVYPGVPMAPRPVFGNPVYYDHYHRKLTEVQLPTPTMLRMALPEGVLFPGGRLDGFLFFEKVPADYISAVTFRAELVGVEDGAVLGTVAIPFRVEEAGLEMAEAPEY